MLLYGHAKNAYWYGSQLSIEETRRLAPYQNATGLQVTSAVLAGIVWMLENPERGIVEADEMDFRRCLEVQRPYLGPVIGRYTDWTPLERPRRAVPGGPRHQRPLAVHQRAGELSGSGAAPGSGARRHQNRTGGPTAARFVAECRSLPSPPAFPLGSPESLEVVLFSGRKRGIAGRRRAASGGIPGIESFREITTV